MAEISFETLEIRSAGRDAGLVLVPNISERHGTVIDFVSRVDDSFHCSIVPLGNNQWMIIRFELSPEQGVRYLKYEVMDREAMLEDLGSFHDYIIAGSSEGTDEALRMLVNEGICLPDGFIAKQ